MGNHPKPNIPVGISTNYRIRKTTPRRDTRPRVTVIHRTQKTDTPEGCPYGITVKYAPFGRRDASEGGLFLS